MKNVYDGVVRTGRRGFATVRMPRWFDALNRRFRYQLTVLGRSYLHPELFERPASERIGATATSRGR